jgi:hypothetical protein
MDPMPTILDTLAGEAALHIMSGVGYRTADQLPTGHVCVTHQRTPHTDDFVYYYGPVIHRTEDHICIDVWGSPMTFPLVGTDVVEGTA